MSERLARDPRSARQGRQLVATICRDWGLGAICDDLLLPVSELVTNAVVHAATEARVTISLTSDFIEFAVRDNGPRHTINRPVTVDAHPAATPGPSSGAAEGAVADTSADALATGGRGLPIVDTVADEWGVEELTDGKTVWFRIRVPTRWQPDHPCHCRASGRTTPGLRIS